MTTRNRLSRGAFARPAALLAVLILVIGCGGAASERLSAVGQTFSGTGGQDGSGTNPAEQPAAEPVDEGTGIARTVLDAARPDLLIIKTGTLDLQVEAVGDAVAAAAGRITALGGYVSASEQVGEDENVTATITYRIPADRWEEALEALRSLAIKVVAERTGTEDVTGQVVDLRARIANLQATEKALQEIMTRATKIADVLAVQAELTTVRGQIEEATAQKQHLEAQAAFSTLTVRFGLEPEPAVITSQKKFDPGSEVDRATASLVEVLQGLATAGIWFGIVWLPILVVVGFVGLIAGLALRRRRRPRGPAGSGTPGPFGDGMLGASPASSSSASPIEPGAPPAAS
ncbi:MAG TPA: DUF4349 domain-containing protein [Candidatus Sulfomarinibacteraceae bacterium]|nr:DUF4349 domain-containing protein [Candidatus Sulfomarinibacteraceae bacterium]